MADAQYSKVTLRPATPADRPFAERLYFETQRWLIEKLFGWRGDKFERAKFDEFYDERHTQIVHIDGEDIGWLTVLRESSRIEVDSIYIDPKRQNAGLGTHLMEQLIAEAEEAQRTLTLSTAKINPARRLYERLGFVAVDESEFKVYMARKPRAPRVSVQRLTTDEYYQRYDESQRLDDGAGDVERIRTLDILSRYLPSSPAVVVDVGGATGAYAVPLADAGYEVHLVDPVPHHVEQALKASSGSKRPLANCIVGDARALQFSDKSADVVLFLGPLYHLTERADRLQALREARRVLRPGGRIFAAAISRFASLIDGISRDLIADPAFIEIVHRDLREGQHRNPSGDPRYFTDAYFHREDDLKAEVIEAGFALEAVLGVEGPIWNGNNMPAWQSPERRRSILDLLRKVEAEPTLIGASAHLMAIASA